MPVRNLFKTLMSVLVAAVAAVFLWASPAMAHNSLVAASPDKDAVLAAAPGEVKLQFLASLPKTAKLTVTAPDGSSAIGQFTIEGKYISAPFTGTAGGVYKVGYEAGSDDGHVIEGAYQFTLNLPTPSMASTADDVQIGLSTSDAARSVVAAPAADSGGTGDYVKWIGGAAVAGLLVGGLITFLRGRRERTQAGQ